MIFQGAILYILQRQKKIDALAARVKAASS
jgi:hypothetical protein